MTTETTEPPEAPTLTYQLEEHPPLRRHSLHCNEPDFWRYQVLRNGVRLRYVRTANAKTGEVTVWRMRRLGRQTETPAPGQAPLTPFETTQLAGVMLCAPPAEWKESERYLVVPADGPGGRARVEILRHIPKTAAWDREPAAGTAAGSATDAAPDPETDASLVPPAKACSAGRLDALLFDD